MAERNFFIKTERIMFSIWDKNDHALALSLWGNEAVTKYISKTGKFTVQEVEERLKLEIANEKCFGIQYWPFFDKSTGDFIGCCGLRPYSLDNQIYELGFHIKPKYWGKGLGTEAAKAIVNYSFNELGLTKLFAGHNPNNIASENILRKLEFNYIKDVYYAPTELYHPSYMLDS